MDKTTKGIAIGVAVGIVVAVLLVTVIIPEIQKAKLRHEINQWQSVNTAAEEVACRSNLRSLGSGEAMFYGAENRYGTIAELVSSGVFENADQLTCMTCDRGYSVTILDDGESYRICCPGHGSGNHGSIEDGRVSW